MIKNHFQAADWLRKMLVRTEGELSRGRLHGAALSMPRAAGR